MKKVFICAVLSLFTLTGCGGPAPFDTFAQCLTDKGAVMYGNDTCPHCLDQKKDFKGSFDKITYVECRRDFEACQKAGVTSTPTWVIHDKNHVGRQKLTELAKISGCPLNEDKPVEQDAEEETVDTDDTETTEPSEATPL
jgi:glutaredoxin